MAKLDFAGAIERPFQDFKKLSIGALTFLIPVLNIVTGMIGAGYALGLARKPGKLPKWNDWGDLLKQGLFAFIIVIIYSIPFYILGSILMFAAGFGGMMSMGGMPDTPLRILAFLGPAAAVLGILSLIFYYFIPAAIINFAQTKDIRDGFNLEDIMSKLKTKKYFKAWIFTLFYGLVVGTAVGILNFVTAITVIVPLAVFAYGIMILMLTSMDIYGQVWN